MRKERMKKMAELRRASRLNRDRSKSSIDSSSMDISSTDVDSSDLSKDYFLSDREESELETFLISMRLSNKLRDGKTTLKHPSSIRNINNFPLFNGIKHMVTLVDKNPIYWETMEVLKFIEHYVPLKRVLKKFESNEVNGETILNLTIKKDLIDFLQIDDKSAEILSETFEQLRKETILRYVNS